MKSKLNGLALAGGILLVVGVVVWLFVSMLIGIILGVVGLVLLVVVAILSSTTGAKKPPKQAIAQPPVNNTANGTIRDDVTTPPARQANFCTGCGARISPEESFCRSCGKKN